MRFAPDRVRDPGDASPRVASAGAERSAGSVCEFAGPPKPWRRRSLLRRVVLAIPRVAAILCLRSAHPRAIQCGSMAPSELLQRITINPNVCFGKPCIRGHRIWVSLILDLLAAGQSIEEILDDYPDLEELDIRACLAYGAEMSRDRYMDVPMVRDS